MDYRSAVVKVLLFLPFFLRLSSAVTHTLEYSYTMVTPGNNFTSVGLLDGEEFMYYDSNTARMTPKTEWMENETDSSYWQKETNDVKFQKDWLKDKLDVLSPKQIKEVNTLQRVYGCEIDDKNVTRGYDKSIYNGRDFISLDLNTGTWTAVDDRAQNFAKEWDPKAGFWKNFVEIMCIDRLQSYKKYSTKKEDSGGAEGRSEGGAEGRSDIPEGGSDGQSDAEKTVVTVVVVLVLVAAAAAGFVIYKKKLCAHLRSGYIGARQNPKQ
ncbi:H-2 class I histocompatibility antigen, Q9 alpha chain-like isoform 1-T1 [Clarias gariepinus]